MSDYNENEERQYSVKKKEYKEAYKPEETIKDILRRYEAVDWDKRNLKKETLDRFGVRCKVSTEVGPVTIKKVYFPYYSQDGKLCGFKVKDCDKDKHEKGHFYTVGHVGVDCQLFGQKIARKKARFLWNVEGEVDCLSAYQSLVDNNPREDLKHLTPAITSIGCGTVHAVEHMSNNLKFLKGYKEVVLAYDNDELSDTEKKKKNPGMKGKEATEAVGSFLSTNLDPKNKLSVISWPDNFNDCSDALQKGKSSELTGILLGVEEYKSEKIVGLYDVFEEGELYRPMQRGIYLDSFPILMDKWLGVRMKEATLMLAPSGVGKCLKIGTKIIMFDSSLKNIEDIQKDDLVLGVDGSQRKVLSTHSGFDDMYEVFQIKGRSYVVNSEHILSLKASIDMPKRCLKVGDTLNIPIREYINLSHWSKLNLKGWVPDLMDFETKQSLFEPWAIGNWLADGTRTKPDITVNTDDKEIINEWKKISSKLGYRADLKNYKSQKKSKGKTLSILGGFLNDLRQLGILNNKFIPTQYKFGTVNDRVEILSGILDGDGYLIHNTYEICFKEKQLCDDVAFVARSLGLKVTTRMKFSKCQGFEGRYYHRMFIFGDIDILNLRLSRKRGKKRKQIKNPLITGIEKVEEAGMMEYFGIEVDGDHLLMLDDFTVIHNSSVTAEMAYNFAEKEGGVGGIFLEEGMKKTCSRFIARRLEVHPNLYKFDKEKYKTLEEHIQAEQWVGDTDNFLFIDHYGPIKIKDLIDLARILIYKHGRKFIVLDHISLTVTGNGDIDERAELENAMINLTTLCEQCDVHIMVVAHINRNSSTISGKEREFEKPKWKRTFITDGKGTQALEALAHNIIPIDVELLPDGSRGRIRLVMGKNREADILGFCDVTKMNDLTGVFYDASKEEWQPEGGGYGS